MILGFYFDHYFMSLRLLGYVAREVIFSPGTVTRNRIPDWKLLLEKHLWKNNEVIQYNT